MEETAFKLPQTGGKDRTPRTEIIKTRQEGWRYEPDLACDFSPSMYWSTLNEEDRSLDYPHISSRRSVLEAFLPMYIQHMEQFDSQAAIAKAKGDEEDEGGGVMTAGFSGHAFLLGDVNTGNVLAKLAQAWETAAQRNGTLVGPAMQMLNDHFKEEFGDDQGLVEETTVLTDGEPQDPEALLDWIHTANERHVYLVGILGHGKAAKKTYDLYRKAADENTKRNSGTQRVHIVNWDAVSDPFEIGRDLCKMAS